MDPYQTLLSRAQNLRPASSSSASSSANNITSSSSPSSTNQLLASAGMLASMNPTSISTSIGDGSSGASSTTTPFSAMTMAFPNAGNNTNTLAPLHRLGGLNGLTSAGSSLASLNPGANKNASASGSSSSTANASNAGNSNSKKRKSPSASVDDGSDNESASQSVSKDGEYVDPKAKRRAQIAKAARKHRQRQKDELISLRAKVKELKEQIEVLQSSEPSEHNTEMGWKQEAEQHAEIRARVDQENEFLRRTLMEQMKFIQKLQDYFMKQPLLNMPSLDMILNSSNPMALTASTSNSSTSSSPASMGSFPMLSLPTGAPGLMGAAGTSAPNTVSSSSGINLAASGGALSSTALRDNVLHVVEQAVATSRQQTEQCESCFHQPKNPSMTYFGLEVQYEIARDEMGVFFRHQLYDVDARDVADQIWLNATNPTFENQFQFVDVSELLEEINPTTRYIRRVINLSIPNDQPNQNANALKMKEESLYALHKKQMEDGSVYIISKSVHDDPRFPKTNSHIRRNQTGVVCCRNFVEGSTRGCLVLWSIKVVDLQAAERELPANISDVVLRNLFDISPVYVKAHLDKVQSVLGAYARESAAGGKDA